MDTVLIIPTNSFNFFEEVLTSYIDDTLIINIKQRKNFKVWLFGKTPLFYTLFTKEKQSHLKGVIPIKQDVDYFKLNSEIWLNGFFNHSSPSDL